MSTILRRPGVVLADALLSLLFLYDARSLLAGRCLALDSIPRIATTLCDFIAVILRAANDYRSTHDNNTYYALCYAHFFHSLFAHEMLAERDEGASGSECLRLEQL